MFCVLGNGWVSRTVYHYALYHCIKRQLLPRFTLYTSSLDRRIFFSHHKWGLTMSPLSKATVSWLYSTQLLSFPTKFLAHTQGNPFITPASHLSKSSHTQTNTRTSVYNFISFQQNLFVSWNKKYKCNRKLSRWFHYQEYWVVKFHMVSMFLVKYEYSDILDAMAPEPFNEFSWNLKCILNTSLS